MENIFKDKNKAENILISLQKSGQIFTDETRESECKMIGGGCDNARERKEANELFVFIIHHLTDLIHCFKNCNIKNEFLCNTC